MIIRSQDKTTITNFQNVTDILASYREEKIIEIIAYLAGGGKTHLAIYSTEEKAIKVLDMIQNAYTQYGTIKNGLGSIHGAFNIPKCFQMPSDKEVEV